MKTKLRTQLAGKNLLFVELIVVILFFSLAAAACVSLFAQAYTDSRYSEDLTNAVIMAQNAAEYFKATGEELPDVQDGELTMQLRLEGNTTALISVLKEEEVVYEITVRRWEHD